MTDVPDWVTQVPATAATTDRNSVAFAAPPWTNLDQAQLDAMRQKLLQSIWQVLVQTFTGGLLPGDAQIQLGAWAQDVAAVQASMQDAIDYVSAELQRSWLKFQNLVDNVSGGVDNDVSDLITALKDSASKSGDAWQSWDTVFSDLGFSVTTAAQFATWITGVANAGPWPGTTNANALANRAIYKPSYLAIDATADSVFPVSQISGTAPTLVTITPDIALIGYIGTPDAGLKQSIIWLAPTIASGLSLYFTVYQVNVSTGALTLVFSTGPVTSAVAGWNYTNIPSGSQFVSVQGAWYAVELMVAGPAGTSFSIAGIPNHWLPVNTTIPTFPQSLGASRASLTPAVFDVADTTGVRTLVSAATTFTETDSFSAPLDDDVFGFVAVYSPNITSITATYNGVPMTLQNSQNPNGNSTFGELVVFRLLGGGTGSAKNLIVTVVNSTPTDTYISIRAASYSIQTGSPPFTTEVNNANSTALSIAPTGIPAGITIVAFMSIGTTVSASIGAPTGATQRAVWNSGGIKYPALMVCDTTVVGAFNVTATSGTGSPWAAIALTYAGEIAWPPSSIAAPGPPYNNDVPWFGLGGALGPPQHDPDFQSFIISGTYSVPAWMAYGDLFDIVLVGDGGGSGPGNTVFAYGPGGNAGQWFATTLVYGVDIPLTTTTFTITVGQGGAGGIVELSAGADGAGCGVTITGYSGAPIAAAGGFGSHVGAHGYFGLGAQDFMYTSGLGDTTYPGGGDIFRANNNGYSPGGGASGGSYLANGSDGGAGQIWITAYQ